MALRPIRQTLRGGFLVKPFKDIQSADYFIPFLFNPRPEFQDQHDWVEHKVPGRADPFLQYLNGQAQNINIELFVEQERIDEFKVIRIDLNNGGSLAAKEQQKFTYRSPTFQGTNSYLPTTAREYVEMIQNLGYPRIEFNNFADKSPPRLLFVYGKRLISVKIKRVSVAEEEHDENLELEYAKIQMTLVRDDPLYPRVYRIPGSTENAAFTPEGISFDDIRDSGLGRNIPNLGAGSGYTWR